MFVGAYSILWNDISACLLLETFFMKSSAHWKTNPSEGVGDLSYCIALLKDKRGENEWRDPWYSPLPFCWDVEGYRMFVFLKSRGRKSKAVFLWLNFTMWLSRSFSLLKCKANAMVPCSTAVLSNCSCWGLLGYGWCWWRDLHVLAALRASLLWFSAVSWF